MASFLRAKYQKIIDIKEQMRSIKDELMDEVANVKDMVDKMDNSGYWRGSGFESYRDKMAGFKWNFDAYVDNLSKMVSHLDEVVEKYQRIDSDVKSYMNK